MEGLVYAYYLMYGALPGAVAGALFAGKGRRLIGTAGGSVLGVLGMYLVLRMRQAQRAAADEEELKRSGATRARIGDGEVYYERWDASTSSWVAAERPSIPRIDIRARS